MRDHGVRSFGQLMEVMSRGEIARRVATGELVRVSRGWYALPIANEQVMRALRAGGRLGCLNGCQFYGVWVPPHSDLHVAYADGTRPSPKPGVSFHPAGTSYPQGAMWPLEDCLVQASRHHDFETALIVLEAALNTQLLNRRQVQDVVAHLPVRRREVLRLLRRAESGSETRVRLFFHQRNVPVRSQVDLEGIGRVDLLVGDRLIVECDSDEHHRSKEAHQNDRQRDLAARIQGFETIRLTYHQIWLDWEATRSSLLRLLRARRHIRRR